MFCDSASELERYGLHFFLGVFLPLPASCFSEIVIFRNLLHNFSRVLGLSLVFFLYVPYFGLACDNGNSFLRLKELFRKNLNASKPSNYCLKKYLNASRLDLLNIPQSGGKMSKRLGGIIGCKYKASSWHLNGFPDGSNIRSTVKCRGETHRYAVHLH